MVRIMLRYGGRLDRRWGRPVVRTINDASGCAVQPSCSGLRWPVACLSGVWLSGSGEVH
jgi:hypothetical protein